MLKVIVGSVAAVCVLAAGAAYAQPYEHLKCYKFRDTQTFQTAEADIDTIEAAFGLQHCDIKRKAKLFCIPATKTVTDIVNGTDSPFLAQDLAFEQICYKVRCPTVTIPDQQLSDQFGTRMGTNFKSSLLCVPGVIGPPPTTLTTTTTSTTSTTTTTDTTTTSTTLPSATFSLRAGDTGLEQAVSVVVDSAGNTIAVGSYASATDFGAGPLPTPVGGNEMFVVKLDPSGAAIWSQGFTGTGDQLAVDVAVNSGDQIFVTGIFANSVDFGGGPLTSLGGNDAFLVKFDTDGSYLWSLRFGDTGQEFGRSLAVDAADDVIAVGTSGSASIDFGAGAITLSGGGDLYVVKFDSLGAVVWDDTFGTLGAGHVPGGVAVDPMGNVLVTASLSGASGVNYGGGVLTSAGSSDIIALKLDSSGAFVWSNKYGDSAAQAGSSIAVDSTGNVYLACTVAGTTNFGGGGLMSAGGNDVAIAKLNGLGAYVWAQIYGDSVAQSVFDVTVDVSGNVVASGSFAGAIDFGSGALTSSGLNDVFIVKKSPIGAHISSQKFGNSATQSGGGVTTDPSGNRYIVGGFQGTIDFGDGPLTDTGGGDAFIAKLAP